MQLLNNCDRYQAGVSPSLSQHLATLTPTGQTTIQYGGINLNGNGTNFNVFNLAGTDVSRANYFGIRGDANSTVVVNVSGTNVSLKNFGFNIQGTNRQNVLYNFYEATSLDASGISIEGSILAPLANFNFNNGQINGNIITASLRGNGESHNHLFTGKLPHYTPPAQPKPVPEPTSLPGIGVMAVLSLVAFKRHQKHCLQ